MGTAQTNCDGLPAVADVSGGIAEISSLGGMVANRREERGAGGFCAAELDWLELRITIPVALGEREVREMGEAIGHAILSLKGRYALPEEHTYCQYLTYTHVIISFYSN